MLNSEISNDVIVYSFDQVNKLNAVISENVKYEIGRHYEKHGTRLILDLGNIRFVDSSGFGALLSVMKKARSNKGIFRICNIYPDVMGSGDTSPARSVCVITDAPKPDYRD